MIINLTWTALTSIEVPEEEVLEICKTLPLSEQGRAFRRLAEKYGGDIVGGDLEAVYNNCEFNEYGELTLSSDKLEEVIWEWD